MIEKEVTLTLTKKARVWFHCECGARLAIRPETENFELNKAYTMMASEEDKRDQKYGTLNYYFSSFEIDNDLIAKKAYEAKREVIDNLINFLENPKSKQMTNGGFKLCDNTKLNKLRNEVSKLDLTDEEKSEIEIAESNLESVLDEKEKRIDAKIKYPSSFFGSTTSGIYDSSELVKCWECGNVVPRYKLDSEGTCGEC